MTPLERKCAEIEDRYRCAPWYREWLESERQYRRARRRFEIGCAVAMFAIAVAGLTNLALTLIGGAKW